MIIDVHAHLGDICFENGGGLIERRGVSKKPVLDVMTLSELFHHPLTSEIDIDSWIIKLEVRSSMERNRTGTRENFKRSMQAAGVDLSVALPVPPNVTFADLKAAAAQDPAIVPFTGVDFTREYDVEAELAADVAAGARGLKLHPILQRERLTSEKTFRAVAAFSRHGLPVLMHTGVCYYYPHIQDKPRAQPAFGELHDVQALVRAFPEVKFIAGHAGLTTSLQAMELLGGLKNVWVEGSFQNPRTLRRLIKVFGPDRVMFASDWPWGNRGPAVKIMKRACQGDQALLKRVFYQNAAELLGLTV